MILKACVICGALSDRARCERHRRRPWEGSTRRARTISGWGQQRRARDVLKRDRGICHLCGLSGADQADHLVPLAEGGTDDMSNLAAAHRLCHQAKISEEALRGRERAKAQRSAPARHPGL